VVGRPHPGRRPFAEAPVPPPLRPQGHGCARRPNRRARLDINFEALASSEAAGYATPEQLASLRAAPAEWAQTLRRLLAETEAALVSARRISGAERDQVLADLTGERDQLRAALQRVAPERSPAPDKRPEKRPERRPAGERRPGPATPAPAVAFAPPALQASWQDGRVVLWAGSSSVPRARSDERDRLMEKAGAGSMGWEAHPGVPVPAGGRADAVSAPLEGALGWLVGVGAGQLAPDAAPGLRWLGEVAVWATELAAQGRVVPNLVGPTGAQAARPGTAEYTVRWVPAVLDTKRLRSLSQKMPGSVAALEPPGPPDRVCRSVLAAAVDAVCRAGAARLVTPATVPVARSRSEVSEAVLAGFDGTPFTAATRTAAETAAELARWAAPVTARKTPRLTVRLASPGDDGGWLLSVEAAGADGRPQPAGDALADSDPARAAAVETELTRLERLYPPLLRPARHRGRVVLDGGEAWDLMSQTGSVLEGAGFAVRVPALSRRRPTTRLQLTAEAFAGDSVVGAQQLSKVRWSVLVDDVELDAGAIARLSAQARPLLKVKGGWVELEKADLEAAAAALAERAGKTELSGAAILRHAVGLEGGPLGGPALVEGSGWAVDLVRGAAAGAARPLPAPAGFSGELRHYQAEARGWLGFLDRAGLGGCLAMDMGLGKTPTVLAHVLEHRDQGPALVIAPLAVLGNWAAEAQRFTPELRVRVHHGTERAAAEDVAAEAAGADIVLSTYATAVRDVEALAGVDWARIVVDEAQGIKNPASDTAQQLRRIPARSRLALTGTPVENGLGDLWAILDFTNPGLVGPRPQFVEALGRTAGGDGGPAGEGALRALNGLLVFRRTKAEPEIAAELPDKIDELDHCAMTAEQVGLYQAVLDRLLADPLEDEDRDSRKGNVLAAITALKQICNHPAAYVDDDTGPLDGRSGKLARLEELVDAVFFAGERMLVFTHFARWGERLADHLTQRTGVPIACYHGGLSPTTRDRLVREFQEGRGPGAMVLSIKAGGTGLNLTAAGHVVLYDRWWNPAVEDQARDRAWRIGQAQTVVCHRLVCPGTVDERVEEVVAGKRRIADLVLPARSSLADLDAEQLRAALGLRPDAIVDEVASGPRSGDDEAAA
jgi:superfamily II DNA or RNA helicase